MKRRDFLKFGVGAGLTTGLSAYGLIPKPKSQHSDIEIISAFNKSNKHFVGKYNLKTGTLIQQQIPFRAHDIVTIRSGQVLSFGRRPNKQCVFSDLNSQQQTIIDSGKNRHFYGHGCLDKSGDTLLTTENDYEDFEGIIGIRDAKTFEQIGEYSSYGIGPHDIHLMPDNKTLVVANGGIQTHPDFGRRKLNLKTMKPSLTFIDVGSGQKIDEYHLQDSLLSIRHLSVTNVGNIGVSTQYQGNLYRSVPSTLLAWFDGARLNEFKMTQQMVKQCQGYIADVAIDKKNQVLAATSPRGNNISFWDTNNQTLVEMINIPEPSGIIFEAENNTFLVSNAKGAIYGIANNRSNFLATPLQVMPDAAWDNHMIIHT